MPPPLRSYFFTFKLGIEKALVYRTNFLFCAFFNLLPLFAIITLWKTIYTDPEQRISGYTVLEMVSYYLLVTVIDNMTSVTEDDWQIATDIKDGHISQFLLRPIEYLSYRLCLFSAARCIFTVAAAGPVTLFLLSQHDYFLWPASGAALVCFALSLILSALLQFLLSFTLAMLAFWVFEISSFAFVLLAMQRLLGGQMFPLDILPAWIQRVLFLYADALHYFFPRQHLSGPRSRNGSRFGADDSSRLGRHCLVYRTLCLAAWIAELYRRRRLSMTTETSTLSAANSRDANPFHRRRWCNYPAMYLSLARNSVARDMTFKVNFLFWIFVELLWFALQLVFNNVLYMHTDRIGTWTKWEVVLLIGTSHFIQQLFQALFLVNCSNLSELVHTGKFDFMLLLPVNTRFLVSCRQIDFTGFISAASGLVVVVFAAHKLGLHPSGAQVIGFAALCAAAILIHYSLMFVMASVSFWSVRAQGIMMAYYNLFSIARMPDVAFAGTSRAFFTLVIPMLIVSNVPVKMLAQNLSSPGEITIMVVMCVAMFTFSAYVWKSALRQYTSASS